MTYRVQGCGAIAVHNAPVGPPRGSCHDAAAGRESQPGLLRGVAHPVPWTFLLTN